jgi:polyhydroxybutyrate depolymerase
MTAVTDRRFFGSGRPGPTRVTLRFTPVFCGLVVAGCAEPAPLPDRGSADALGAGDGVYIVPDVQERPFWLQVPSAVDDGAPLPLLIGLHDNNGRFEDFRQLTCPDGQTGDDGCLTALAERDGLVLVMPSGTSAILFENARGWNAGGGGEVLCTSGRACEEGIDDVAYLDAVIAEVSRAVAIDPARIFITGMGNGAAMAHRAVCERSTVYAAAVAVAGANEVAATQGCPIARPVPVLQIHGDADTCWSFDGTSDCTNDSPLPLVGVTASMEGWRQRNGCSADVDEAPLPDDADDGTRAVRRTFRDCLGGVETGIVVIEGGGHTWPGGHQFAFEAKIGRTSRDVAANDLLLDFFARQRLPDALLPPTDGAP